MHTYQLTTLALATLSTIVNATPIQDPSASLTQNFPAQGTGWPGHIGTHSFGHGPVVPMTTATPLSNASIAISGAITGESCKIHVKNLPKCTSGEATISHNSSCLAMEHHKWEVPKHLKCTPSAGTHVKHWISFRNKTETGQMSFSYQEYEGFDLGHANETGEAHRNGDAHKTGSWTTSIGAKTAIQGEPSAVPSAASKMAREPGEAKHCACSTALASDGVCSAVTCRTVFNPIPQLGGASHWPTA